MRWNLSQTGGVGIVSKPLRYLSTSLLHFEQNAQRYDGTILCRSVVVMCEQITALVAELSYNQFSLLWICIWPHKIIIKNKTLC